MKQSYMALWLLLCANFALASAVQANNVDVFGRIPFVDDVQISLDGQKMAYLQASKGEYLLVVRRLDGAGKPKVLNIPERSLHQLKWLSDDRIFVVMYTSKYIKIERERHTFWRAGIYDVSENEMIWPFQGSNFNFNINSPYILNQLINDPNHILVSYYIGSSINVFKVDIRDGSWEIIADQYKAQNWKTDWNGDIRMFFKFNKEESGFVAHHRINNDEEFTPLYWLEDGKRIPFNVGNVNFDRDNKHILYSTRLSDPTTQAENNNETNTQQQADSADIEPAVKNRVSVVWRGEINSQNEVINVERIFALDNYDIESFSYDYQSDLVNGVHYTKDYSSTHFFERTMQQVQADLEATFPNAAVYITSYDDSKQKWIARVSGAQYGIQYFYYDMTTASIALIANAYPDYDPEQGGRVSAIRYQASDGTEISGYLTLPAQPAKSKKYPLLVLPHGGPESRDKMDFFWERQFFASNGYAVLQPNFRGSEGFGGRFAELGYGEWGRKMQTDLNDGLRYLVDKGVSDPERVCIIGSSYGGYAAMMGAILTPELYQCAVSFAGVTFLEGMFHHSVKQKYGFSYWEKSIGNRFSQDELRQYSPLYAASSSSSPMLIMHGRHDTIVPPYHAERMLKTFRSKGIRGSKVKMISDATHWFTLQSTRETYLTESLQFINKHLAQ